jgi:hypothetical protein
VYKDIFIFQEISRPTFGAKGVLTLDECHENDYGWMYDDI